LQQSGEAFDERVGEAARKADLTRHHFRFVVENREGVLVR